MRLSSSTLALALALLAGACAPAATPGGTADAAVDEANRITVRVNNSLTPPSPITVYALDTTGGSRRLLGSLSSIQTATLSFNPPRNTGTYRLMARTTAGRELFSTPVTATLGQTIVWDVGMNAIRVM